MMCASGGPLYCSAEC